MHKGDFQTTAWHRFEEHLNAELQKLRAKNDGDLSTEETAKLRGRIAQIKQILAMPTDIESQGNDLGA